MASLNDENLIRIITEDFNEYEAEALQIAKQELGSRNINVDDCSARKRFVYKIILICEGVYYEIQMDFKEYLFLLQGSFSYTWS